MTSEEAQNELRCYTLAHPGSSFLHQHVVDAIAAQNADDRTKPITLVFSLVGLYLHLERKFSGRQVQRAHQRLARHKREWPSFPIPVDRGSITAADVIDQPEGAKRDEAIDVWCAAVWASYRDCHGRVAELVHQCGIDDEQNV